MALIILAALLLTAVCQVSSDHSIKQTDPHDCVYIAIGSPGLTPCG